METQIKVIHIDRRTNFIQVTAELDGQLYEGILIGKGGVTNEKRTQDMVSS